MTPGAQIRVDEEVARVYRRPGAQLQGTVIAVSPNGEVARVHLDDLADSWIRTEHLIPGELSLIRARPQG